MQLKNNKKQDNIANARFHLYGDIEYFFYLTKNIYEANKRFEHLGIEISLGGILDRLILNSKDKTQFINFIKKATHT